MRSELSGSNDDSSTSGIYTAGYGFLAAGLMLTSVFSFMSVTDRINFFQNSNLAAQIYNYRMLWLIGPIAIILLTSILGRLFKR